MIRQLDTQTFVVLGEGLAAGAGHFSLSDETQRHSFPALIARQLGTAFEQPLIEPPGVGNVGFQPLPALVPELLQTTVLHQFPRSAPDLHNLSIPGLSLADALGSRPRAPLVQPDDAKQTLINLILGAPALATGSGLLSQVEYACQRQPTLVLVALGYQELLEPLVEGHAHSSMGDLAAFGDHYAELLDQLGKQPTTIAVATIPDPLDTAYFSDLETAAWILRTEVPFLQQQYGLQDGDLLRLEGLIDLGYEFMAREISGNLPAGAVLSAGEAATFRQGVARLNDQIRDLAEQHNAMLFDLHGLLQRLAQRGLEVPGRRLSSRYLDGFYLLNGVFPGATGHALIANEFIALLNRQCQRNFPAVDLAPIMEDDANLLAKIADGPRFSDEFLEPRTADELPQLPSPDPSLLNVYPPFDPDKINVFPVQTTFLEPPFDIGGTKAANNCQPLPGVPAGGMSDPQLKHRLELPPGLEQTLPLDLTTSYYGDALRPVDFPDERPFLAGLPTFGANGNTLFGGLAMVDSHLSGQVHLRFSEPDENHTTNFEISHPGGLVGDDGVLAAPKLFKLPSQLNRVYDVPGLVSTGKLNLKTGVVTDLRYAVIFLNTQTLTLFGVNPNLPVGPLIFPGPPNAGSTWARFDQRADGRLDFTFAGNLFLPLGKEFGGDPVRFPLPFGTPDLRCASIVARGTALHPHIHISTRPSQEPDLGDDAPPIPVNTVREFTAFTHNNNFGDVFGLHVDELGGEGTGRCHLMGRFRVQFGPRFGDSVPFALSVLPPGGLLSEDPKPLPYLPPGTSRGLIGFDEQLKFPSGVTYDQTDLSSAMDPNNAAIGAVDLRTGKVRNEFLARSFVVQQLFVNLSKVEPCTPADSFNYQGEARFEKGPGNELIFSLDGNVFLPYPKGFRFPAPTADGTPAFRVVAESRLDPFLRFQGIHRQTTPGTPGTPGTSQTPQIFTSGEQPIDAVSSIGARFSYRYQLSSDPAAEASFEYTDHEQKGTFVLSRLSWLSAVASRWLQEASEESVGESTGESTDEPENEPQPADTITFSGFGSWSLDSDLHQVSVQICTSKREPYVGILIDGGSTSNVNTKPEVLAETRPLRHRQPTTGRGTKS